MTSGLSGKLSKPATVRSGRTRPIRERPEYLLASYSDEIVSPDRWIQEQARNSVEAAIVMIIDPVVWYTRMSTMKWPGCSACVRRS